MSLANFTRERREIPLGGGQSLSVGALTPSHLSILIRTHLADLETAFKLLDQAPVTQDEGSALIMTIVQEAPGLAANVIALCAGEPEHADKAADIPAPLQIVALSEIAQLTFTEVGGVKKFMSMFHGIVKLSPEMTERLTSTLRKVPQFASTSELDAT